MKTKCYSVTAILTVCQNGQRIKLNRPIFISVMWLKLSAETRKVRIFYLAKEDIAYKIPLSPPQKF